MAFKDVLALDAMFLRIINAFRALTSQSYTESNVKKGMQFELSADTPTLANAANIDVVFTTGAVPVIIKARQVKFNGASLLTRVYRAPTVTGGTGALVTPFNLSDINPVATTVTIRTGATVTAPGTEFGAPTYDIGSTGQGNSSLSTYAVTGVERVLRANTAYLLRITNDSGATQRVSSYLTWYEGELDFPNTDYT